VEDLNFTRRDNGAGVVIIYDDGSGDTILEIRDGSDLAYIDFGSTLNATVPQTFNFPAASTSRTAMVNLHFASVSGTASGHGFRPTSIEITTGGATNTLSDLLDSNSGDEWDAFTIAVNVPPGATNLTVEPFSRDDFGTGRKPASFDWLAAAFSVQEEGDPGRMTGGGSVFTLEGARVTRGFEIHCDLRDPNNIQVNWPGNRFHLTDLTAAVCIDNVSIDQLPRSAPFDTFEGEGDGLLNGDPGATIDFTFVDAGEPGVNDTARIVIKDAGGNVVLDVSGNLDRGNIQAHLDNQSTL